MAQASACMIARACILRRAHHCWQGIHALLILGCNTPVPASSTNKLWSKHAVSIPVRFGCPYPSDQVMYKKIRKIYDCRKSSKAKFPHAIATAWVMWTQGRSASSGWDALHTREWMVTWAGGEPWGGTVCVLRTSPSNQKSALLLNWVRCVKSSLSEMNQCYLSW